MTIEKVLYRAHAQATGGRDGRAVSSDNQLDVRLTTPRELGGAGGEAVGHGGGSINRFTAYVAGSLMVIALALALILKSEMAA